MAISALIFIIFFSLLILLHFVVSNIVKLFIRLLMKDSLSSFSAIKPSNSSKICGKMLLILSLLMPSVSSSFFSSVFFSRVVISSVIVLLFLLWLHQPTVPLLASLFLFFPRLILVFSWTFFMVLSFPIFVLFLPGVDFFSP